MRKAGCASLSRPTILLKRVIRGIVGVRAFSAFGQLWHGIVSNWRNWYAGLNIHRRGEVMLVRGIA